jgi:RNA polymerase sigma-70 factor, ECF subfamily
MDLCAAADGSRQLGPRAWAGAVTNTTGGPEPDRHRPVLDSLGTPQPTQQWKALADRAYRAAWPLLQNREDCLEAAQEAMAALWEMPGEPRDLHAWVRVVARNKAYDIITVARRTRLARDRLAGMASSSCPDPMDDVDDQLHVMAVLADLPSGERLACLLCWYAGMSRKDVAEHMGVSDETVKTWLKRARRRMRVSDQPGRDDT